MCEICVSAQDAAQPTGDGATADAWARAAAAHDAWLASLPDDHPVNDLDCEGKMLAWADHVDATCVERPVN